MENITLQTVDRALNILEILSEEVDGLTATEIREKVGLNKTTVHRLIATLANRGFIEKNDRTGAYIIGLKMVEISSIRLNNIELKTEAAPYLREFAYKYNQPVQVATYSDGEAVYIEKIEPINSIRAYSQIGKRIPIYCSAVGKALLLQWNDEKIMNLLNEQDFVPHTPKTLPSSKEVLHEIKEARTSGFTIDNEEHEPGIFCVAAPIYDYRGEIIAAVSTAGSNKSFLMDKEAGIALELKEVANKISKRIGYKTKINR